MLNLKEVLQTLADGKSLSALDSYALFDFMISGSATDSQIGAMLMGLRQRGETIDEIVGAVKAMRSKMNKIIVPENSVDIVGTGGDGAGTYNISTCAMFITAGVGIPVAKHGNKALSSNSGAADVLKSLGVNVDISKEMVEKCLRQIGIGFMYAPKYHPALKRVMPVREELAFRTIFNVLGPLMNPGQVKKHLVGVYSQKLVEPIANALLALGSERALVVYGEPGFDEISTVGTTYVAELAGGKIRTYELDPEDFGLMKCRIEEIRGGTPEHNAMALRNVLEGKENCAYREIAVFNAAGAIIVAGKANSWQEGIELAQHSIASGKALTTLERLIEFSNS